MNHNSVTGTGGWKRISAILAAFLILVGCSNTYYPAGEQEENFEAALSSQNQVTGYEYSVKSEDGNITIWESEHGTLSVETKFSFPEAAEQAIFSYMERYYKAAATLKMVALDDLFSDSESSNSALNRNAWEYLTGLRAMQHTDLRLTGYRYELSIEDSRIQKDGSYFVSLNENCVLQFAEHPDVDSECHRIRHVYVLVRQDDGWKIREHLQSDGIYQNILGEYWQDDLELLLEESKEISEAADFFTSQKSMLLNLSREQMQLRKNAHSHLELPAVHHQYDREAAVSYSHRWVGQRNGDWDDFTGQGGNCQNYVSQSLYAGGIPRDISGRTMWSWKRPGTWLPEDKERSLSWINVEVFRQYVSFNHGYGLSALPDAPYLEGEIGDVIQMGFPDRWSHTVLISRVITDARGNTVDYLVNSNTADLKNFPVSAYTLPCQTLTKILGWNEW